MFQQVFQQFGLSKNEAIIYEILLRDGESNVAEICKRSQIHRRNVYDSLRRLIDKGYVIESFTKRESLYRAMNPEKFREEIKEREAVLDRALPHMQSLYESKPTPNEVYLYQGTEGWKNYMRDILREGADFYCLGGKGGWMDDRTKDFFPKFIKGIRDNDIQMWHIFDHEVQEQGHGILQYVGENYKFFPPEFSTHSSWDIFGDRVAITSSLKTGEFEEDNFTIAVFVNPQVAEAFRTWFKFMWQSLK